MNSNGEYTFYNLDDCTSSAHRYEGALLGSEDGDQWQGPYDHRDPGPTTTAIRGPYNDRRERCQPPTQLEWTSVPHSGQYLDGCISRCLDRSLPSQCGLLGGIPMTPQRPYESSQPHHHRQGNGYHGLGATGERGPPRGGGLCPQGRTPRIPPIVYECYSADEAVYPGFPSCSAVDGLRFPPHGNCLISSDHNGSMTTYKWMTVKRGLTKTGKSSHLNIE